MRKLTSNEIAETFLQFFAQRDHRIIEGVSLMPRNDPTLLFINSGMAPLKDYFLGSAEPPLPRLCNVQPCLRTTDINDVGDRHHLTYFEMLGSWSIGDYYKEKAIELAYELLVDVLQFDPQRLYATVFKGDSELGLPPDEISAGVWEQQGIATERIVALGKEDNFWGPAGKFGPCGPCTEVFYDCGEQFGPAYQRGGDFDTTKRYIEIWNAGVFIELNKTEHDGFQPLPLRSVDTGSGLERMAMIMNGHRDVYQTDTLRPIVEVIAQQYQDVRQQRIISDHLRAATMIMAEGSAPSNSGAGYVLRRLLRKSIAIALAAGGDCAVFDAAIAQAITTMQERYPHLQQSADFIHSRCRREIEDFEPVVQAGLRLLDGRLQKLKTTRSARGDSLPLSASHDSLPLASSTSARGDSLPLSASHDSLPLASSTEVPADFIFELVATHGLPLEIISVYLERRGFSFNDTNYEGEVAKHRQVSRAGQKERGVDTLLSLVQGVPTTEFLGYQHLQATSAVLALIAGEEKVNTVQGEAEFFFVIAATPFYAEAGGQVGDRGTAKTAQATLQVLDVQKKDDIYLHRARLTAGTLQVGEQLELQVDETRRLAIRRNHSVTHLVQSALRNTLGTHIAQKGSYVDEHKFRFDFQHDKAMTQAECHAVEAQVNDWIWQNFPRTTEVLPYTEAIKKGALFMPGENYHEKVRTVSFGTESVELCGGTHVEATGEIGLVQIISEASIAKGIRRVEGVTGHVALQAQQQTATLLQQACELLTVGRNGLLERITKLKAKPSQVTTERKKSTDELSFKTASQQHAACIAQLDGEAEAKELRTACTEKLTTNAIVVLLSLQSDTYRIAIAATQKLSARAVLANFFKQVEGRGGGKDNFAQGGGKKSAAQDYTALRDTVRQILDELY